MLIYASLDDRLKNETSIFCASLLRSCGADELDKARGEVGLHRGLAPWTSASVGKAGDPKKTSVARVTVRHNL